MVHAMHGSPEDKYAFIRIRHENITDYNAITRVNDLAFGRPEEGIIVKTIRDREDYEPTLSLVAELQGEIIGHVLILPIDVECGNISIRTGSLAPIAVVPEHQGKGIGGMLMRAALHELKLLGVKSCVLVGHPEYYPRFGFGKASELGLVCPYPGVPDAAWMAVELEEGALNGIHGVPIMPKEYEIGLPEPGKEPEIAHR